MYDHTIIRISETLWIGPSALEILNKARYIGFELTKDVVETICMFWKFCGLGRTYIIWTKHFQHDVYIFDTPYCQYISFGYTAEQLKTVMFHPTQSTWMSAFTKLKNLVMNAVNVTPWNEQPMQVAHKNSNQNHATLQGCTQTKIYESSNLASLTINRMHEHRFENLFF